MERSLSRSIGLSVVYVNEPNGSLPKKRLIFYPIVMSTARLHEPEKDISYEGDKTKLSGKFLILPQNPLKILWDFIMLVIIICQGIYVPLLIAFEFDVSTEFIYFDVSVTFCLLFDIILTFNTGFQKKGACVMNRSMIIKHYLKTWFFLDILSCFPYEWIINQGLFSKDSYQNPERNWTKATKLIRAIRMGRILRIVKLVKLMKVKFYLYKIEDYLNSEFIGNIMTFLRIVTVIFFIAHWNACIWYFFTKNFIDGETWLNVAKFSEYSQREYYIYSLYWSMYTMISVGYGDVKLTSTYERILAIFSMVIASGLFGYLVGEASSIIQKETLRDSEFKELRFNLNLLMTKHKVPIDLRNRIRKYIEYTYEKRWNAQKENDIIDCLSYPLREEISHIINWPVFQHCKIFPKFFQPNIVESIAYLFEKMNYSPFDHIVKQNELERKIFFIIQGEIELYLTKSRRRIKLFIDEGYFGEIGFFANQPRTANAISVGFSEILTLEYEDAWRLMEKFPSQQKMFLEIEEMCKDDLSVLDIRCSFCDKIGHAAFACFDRNFSKQKQSLKEKWINTHENNSRKISTKKYGKPNFKRFFRPFKERSPIFRLGSFEEELKKKVTLNEKIKNFLRSSTIESKKNSLKGSKANYKYDEILDSESDENEYLSLKTFQPQVFANFK